MKHLFGALGIGYRMRVGKCLKRFVTDGIIKTADAHIRKTTHKIASIYDFSSVGTFEIGHLHQVSSGFTWQKHIQIFLFVFVLGWVQSENSVIFSKWFLDFFYLESLYSAMCV